MNAGPYTLKSFLTDHNLQQILIPEIQRDYVWKTENVEKLLDAILEDSIKEIPKSAMSIEMFDKLPPELRDQVYKSLESQKPFTNVGFLYAYHDNEIADRYMLIDGQQRMTTLFLILLAVYIREGKAAQFKRHYFSGELIKLDYRVRENAHNFLLNFSSYLLGGGDIEKASDQYWFYTDYKNDQTISSVFNNYKFIYGKINKADLTIDYLENQVNFWYFDTNKSAQGEELYLYMNSRGESVQTNENIKANLLEPVSQADKIHWGAKWEDWQQMFWKYRKLNAISADAGFDEFLKWIKIIDNLKSGDLEKAKNQNEYVKTIAESKVFSILGLDFPTIERYFTVINRLLELNIDTYFSNIRLNGTTNAGDYIQILPLIAFADANPEATKLELIRFAHFFYNVSRFEVITKNPYMHTVQALEITNEIIDGGHTDIISLRTLKAEKYPNILTKEELMKLDIYALATDNDERAEIEIEFWDAESFELCAGRIKIIWDMMGFDIEDAHADRFDFDRFKRFKSATNALFTDPSDLLRRALLTKGNYSITNGYNYTLEGHRYSFGNKDWKTIFEYEMPLYYLKGLMTDFVQRTNDDQNPQAVLQEIIDLFLATQNSKDWLYHFIHRPEIMHYSRQKMICFAGYDVSEIFVLQEKKAATYNYEPLKSFIKN